MQERHSNRNQYFNELAITSRKFFMPYVEQFIPITKDTRILEIGCGDGGNLLPFAERGCQVTGVDISISRISQAKTFFQEKKANATFIASDIFELKNLEQQFDLILIHDVIEHISDKKQFISDTKKYLNKNGILFIGFPAWQMPFGGHQQICHNKVISHFPFIHLLPTFLYKSVLSSFGESEAMIKELMEIKKTKTSIELFYKVIKQSDYTVIHKLFYFINPHYEIKFGLCPRKLFPKIGRAHV